MPRVVRNFWIELDVDGKKTRIATGPRHGRGGFSMTIKMREEGGISEDKIRIKGEETFDNQIMLSGFMDRELFSVIKKR